MAKAKKSSAGGGKPKFGSAEWFKKYPKAAKVAKSSSSGKKKATGSKKGKSKK